MNRVLRAPVAPIGRGSRWDSWRERRLKFPPVHAHSDLGPQCIRSIPNQRYQVPPSSVRYSILA
jgi:hypothetical protein